MFDNSDEVHKHSTISYKQAKFGTVTMLFIYRRYLLMGILAAMAVTAVISGLFILHRRPKLPSSPFLSEFNNFISQTDNSQWLNVFYPLNMREIAGYPMLLFVWQYSDLSNLANLDKLNELQRKFKHRLVVLGVVVRDEHEILTLSELTRKLKREISFYNIQFPLIIAEKTSVDQIIHRVHVTPDATVDSVTKDELASKIILVNLQGEPVKLPMEDFWNNLHQKTAKLVTDWYSQNNSPKNKELLLPIFQESASKPSYILKYPTGLAYIPNYSKIDAPAVVIADSGNDRIIIAALSGNILDEIGSGKKELRDGNYKEAGFYRPQAVDYADNRIYVADSGNNSVRVIDLAHQEVQTLLNNKYIDYPQDVKVLNRKGRKLLWVANTGKREIIEVDLADQKASKVLTSGSGIVPLRIAKDRDNILILDQNSHGLVRITEENRLETIPLDFSGVLKNKITPANTTEIPAQPLQEMVLEETTEQPAKPLIASLDDASDIKEDLLDVMPEGVEEDVQGQVLSDTATIESTTAVATPNTPTTKVVTKSIKPAGPKVLLSGIYADDTGIYVTDYYNNCVYRIILQPNKDPVISLYYGNKPTDIGKSPTDIIGVLDRLYITDVDNDRITIVGKNNATTNFFNVIPTRISNRDVIGEYLHNVSKLPLINVLPETEIALTLALPEMWQVNDEAPSFLELYTIHNGEATLLKSYSFLEILNSKKQLTIPPLQQGNSYYLRGTIYYCRKNKRSLCLMQSFEKKIDISIDTNITSDNIVLDFLL